ncbi:type VII toxin-antitoxin system MntA family adenylyltransferase antitoxin [Salinibaculum rarum]|uniref:type VII toxin-antitoxin system MntA family adenylyltransferase antitoxin n=1 Tax=Salinibaculum rarum TaxID=3058903 RepID=UPI00265D677B|nr:nucleotidyltransferase domain-containing protein [Salinibaculum sp. KK48]
MERVEETDLRQRLPVDTLQQLFEERQIRLAICFGSYATGRTHSQSDIDLAVEFEDIRPGDDSYNETFFSVYEAVSTTLETDDVDLLDIHSLSGSLARAVLTDGILVYGNSERVEILREQFTVDDTEQRSPRERLDTAIERIDEHLA